jgi:hypothetical protein
VRTKIKTDATAAKGIATRRGLGKVRHIDTRELWLQEKVGNGDLDIEKVKGTDNVADALTKYVDQGKLHEHIKLVGGETRCDRHEIEIAPAVDPVAVDAEDVSPEEEEDGGNAEDGTGYKVHRVSGDSRICHDQATTTIRKTRWADISDDGSEE